ncbi:hypothetical protein PKNFJJPA_00143 [Salmonella phage vB_SenAc_BPS6]|uniref:Histone-like protein n=9 Tax=Kuttervirus TaxID=2169536 RepID=A0A1W5PUL1_9CAUD|nr:histone family DNA-binding [Salmonella phage SFP10]YP_009283825.1 histone family DNA-binding [Salmonella phage GG32]APD18315.1 hypothetical protein STP07_048 [Salmonella phage STP07]AXC40720.1 putative histone-like protein [Salmonella phage S117]QIG60420.1 putative histone-like protein [Salmonella phage Chennai]QIQ62234.1 putative histone-like protein [Salmonella phage kage]QQO87095.1 hypothetical protein PKNFJJPA_00143 [Salmonella phage vB_SenAc_BPS6]QQO88844.1 hypothetical protein JHLAC
MQSMIKRKIEISMNAHVDMIQQLVADAYEIQKERQIRGVIDPICSGNMLYYRMLRQTGHTAALKKLLSKKFQVENDAYVFGIFHTSRERDAFFYPSRNPQTGEELLIPDVDKKESTTTITHFMGTRIDKANIIVFSDTLHDVKRLAAAREMLQDARTSLTNLTLVVFLG